MSDQQSSSSFFCALFCFFVGLSFTILVLVGLGLSLGWCWSVTTLGFLLLRQLLLLVLAQCLRGSNFSFLGFNNFVFSFHLLLLLGSSGFSVDGHRPLVSLCWNIDNFIFFLFFLFFFIVLLFLAFFLHHFSKSHFIVTVVLTEEISSEMDWALSLSKERNSVSLLEVQVQALLFVGLVQMAENVFWLAFIVQEKADVVLCGNTKINSGFGDVERVLHNLGVLLTGLND